MRLVDRIDLFSKLKEEDKRTLEGAMRTKTYAKGNNIFLEYDPADALYFVLDGIVSIYLDRTCYVSHKGEFFGVEGVFSDGLLHLVAAKAEENTKLILLSSAVFLKLFDDKKEEKEKNGRNVHLLKTILLHTNRRMYQSFHKIHARAGGNIGAVANMLNIYIEKGEYTVTEKGKKIKHKLSERWIAEYCVCHRSTVQRALSQLYEEGNIEKPDRYITILDSE
ncbi:Crp/Fnr family transcriptional regulator [Paenibacillus sp. UNC451MF]|uniref:Crp/Fnr family transcriptional regulator n=1 Tax=Paenibacillus sp. UNC451MF TaxID=1449063 RepID=UPI0004904F9C|nr:Crp/Fnr family transcriptional regulator [Paenibacillus sp. UNC451MF]